MVDVAINTILPPSSTNGTDGVRDTAIENSTSSVDGHEAKYPYNKTLKFSSGHILEFNNTAGSEYIRLAHGPRNTEIVMTKDGDIVIRQPGDRIEEVSGETDIRREKSYREYVNGDYDLTVTGNMTLKVAGRLTYKLSDDVVLTSYQDQVSGSQQLLKTFNKTGGAAAAAGAGSALSDDKFSLSDVISLGQTVGKDLSGLPIGAALAELNQVGESTSQSSALQDALANILSSPLGNSFSQLTGSGGGSGLTGPVGSGIEPTPVPFSLSDVVSLAAEEAGISNNSDIVAPIPTARPVLPSEYIDNQLTEPKGALAGNDASALSSGRVFYDQDFDSRVRSLPVNPALVGIMDIATLSTPGVEKVIITSGGQEATGPNRTGSHRHDNGYAADIQLISPSGKVLKTDNASDIPVITTWLVNAKRWGLKSAGAGNGYMKDQAIHVDIAQGATVGAGAATYWGSPSATRAGAPAWLAGVMGP